MQRYKGGPKASDPIYAWDAFNDRFDWTKEPNEANRYGWIVKIDPLIQRLHRTNAPPWDASSTRTPPCTRTARGQVVVYMGDDQQNEYLYKFVSDGRPYAR
ncbi:alkaline phosphatase PhoX [Castellaniella defragrans]|uniref:alkaline phosphatase PhoX n=1 Tax=Castellaniella defragrans TaxID=75697 RepID=UPI00396A6FDD